MDPTVQAAAVAGVLTLLAALGGVVLAQRHQDHRRWASEQRQVVQTLLRRAEDWQRAIEAGGGKSAAEWIDAHNAFRDAVAEAELIAPAEVLEPIAHLDANLSALLQCIDDIEQKMKEGGPDERAAPEDLDRYETLQRRIRASRNGILRSTRAHLGL